MIPIIIQLDPYFDLISAHKRRDYFFCFRLSKSITRIRLRDFNITWKLHDGYDWERTRNEILDALAYAKVQAKTSRSKSVV